MKNKPWFLIFPLLFNSFAMATNCSDSKFQQFNFWLGEWDVKPFGADADTINVGKSKITHINDGCTLLEEYETPKGYKGTSLNIFDESRQVWHQTWTDNTGLLLQLEGTLIDGQMVLTGSTTSIQNDKEANVLNHKITWTQVNMRPESNKHHVRQVWQTSKDNGVTWLTIFDGEYFPTSRL